MEPTEITVITGATASGKTALAIELAKKINAEIICADSRIVYKNLDIVSAKPDEKEKEGIEHYLIDIVEPNDIDFSAGDFVNYAKKAIDEIKSKNKKIIISGGTWFYIKSLLDEKALPECEIDKNLRSELEKLDNIELWEKLNLLDSKRAQLIHPNNKDKVIRSIEMCISLKMPISEYQRKENENFKVNWFKTELNRDLLYERINKRVDIMLQKGLFEEWQKNKRLYPKSKILYNTIGYKEFFELENNLYPDFETGVEKIKQHTRNFAKRQLTFFRSRPDIKPINGIEEIIKEIK